MIRDIEELSINAWPSLQSIMYDGWLLRFANNYTKRANSINPLYETKYDAEAKIGICEKLYHLKGQKCVFKMTEASIPEKLDALLSDKGYAAIDYTSVQTADLKKFNYISDNITIYEEVNDKWLCYYNRMNKLSENNAAALKQMLENIIPKKYFVSIVENDVVLACGMGVLQNGYIGLFDIITNENFRRKGFGERIVSNIMLLGKLNGAHTAYLQVVMNNRPAMELYKKLGFKEVYEYWYRVK